MKKIILFSLVLYLFSMFIGCSKMNDEHDMYLTNGEIIYVGRVDSTRIYAGKERFKISYWVTDPKAKILKIYWSQKADSVVFDIPTHHPKDSIDLIIGDTSHPIPEGSHTFQFYTSDGEGLRSIIYEEIGNVYGEKFRQTLSPRLTQDVNYTSSDSTLTIDWGSLSSSREIGITVNYIDLEGSERILNLATETMGSQTLIKGLDPTKPVTSQTAFLPEPTAIDTFYSDEVKIEVKESKNVALNKNATSSDNLNDSYIAAYAVDGIVSNTSRWVSQFSGEHWLEIDLGQDYVISSFAMSSGSNGTFSNPIQNFSFQVDIDGAWVDVVTESGNSKPQYSTSFPEVETNKVRLFVYPFNDYTRIYELEVFSTITY